MRTTINQPSYLKKQPEVYAYPIFWKAIRKVGRTRQLVEIVVPTITYCPVMGACYGCKTILV